MFAPVQKIIAVLEQFSRVSPAMQSFLENNLKEQRLEKMDYFLKAGNISTKLAFIEKGIVRGFRERDDKEISRFFLKENDFAWSLKSFTLQRPSVESIQALEPTVVYYLTYDELEYCYKHFEGAERLGRLLIQHYYILTDDKFDLREEKSSTRYELLREAWPDIIGRVPDKYIYSFIGLESATMSRIKRDFRRKK